MKEVVLTKALGRIEVRLNARRIGKDLVVVIDGGQGHIGAVAAGSNCGGMAVSSVLTMPGHRDDRIAKDAAERISKKLGCNCAVIAGVHYDNITPQEIKDVIILSGSLMDELEGALRTEGL
jgi:translation initiation factor 1 (eIF-1/SUI1)